MPFSQSRFAQDSNVRLHGSFGSGHQTRYVNLDTNHYDIEEIDHKRERELRTIRSLMAQRHGYCG